MSTATQILSSFLLQVLFFSSFFFLTFCTLWQFFSEGVYGAASLCFERAEDRRRREWARAASLRATSGILDGSDPQMACNALREAAEIYISMDRAEVAAKCFIELKEYKTAGA